MRVVLDTNVIIAGLKSSLGLSYKILKSLPKKHFTPLLSVALFLEYEAVIKRGGLLPHLSHEDADTFLDIFALCSEHVRLYYLWRPVLNDFKDDMLVELALAGMADVLVTFNTKDFRVASDRFGLNICTPSDFISNLKGHGLVL